MNAFIQRTIAMSVLALTANSWAYPIYPDFLYQINTNPALNVKANISAATAAYIEQVSTESASKVSIGNALNPTASKSAFSSSSALSSQSTFASDVVNLNWRSEASGYFDAPGLFAKQNRSFIIANPRLWFDTQQDDQLTDEKLDGRLLKEMASWARHNEDSQLWIGLNVQEVFPNEANTNGANKGSAENGVAENVTGAPNTAEGAVNRINVSEPSSVALIGSGVLGLILTRRLGKRNRKNKAH